MDALPAFVTKISDFTGWSHAEKIRFFGWYLHSQEAKDSFKQPDIRACYDRLSLDAPVSVGSFLTAMVDRKPREALKSGSQYRLEMRVRAAFDAKYGRRSSEVAVDQLLAALPAQLPSLAERTFLDEALTCFRSGAFRAAIVMAWNLAYAHLCDFVFKHHLAAFNAQLPKSYPKGISVITKTDDFQDLKESQVLQVCRSANITSNSVGKILKEKLDRRNVAAHPSNVTISQLTAEEHILDLVQNVVLKLSPSM